MSSAYGLARTGSLALALLLTGCAAMSDAARRTENIADESRASLTHFSASITLRPALECLSQASAVVILPRVVSASFVVGGSEAQGALFVRDPGSGRWRGPVFLSLAEGSVGFQAGATVSEVLMIVNTPGSLRSLLKGHLRLGIDAAIAIGKGGGGASAITADIDSYALSRGLSVGIALNGSQLRLRPDLDAAWYGKAVTPDDILAGRAPYSPDSGRLAAAVEALARG
jgi:lipid-binding SYLF domain-containing protein